MLRNIALFTLGGITAIAFVLSCGNGGNEVDAQAGCDCPDLSDRVRMVEETRSISATSTGGATALCNEGELLLNGECRGDGVTLGAGIYLRFSGANDFGGGTNKPRAWGCGWDNTTANPVNVKAVAFCLSPLPPGS